MDKNKKTKIRVLKISSCFKRFFVSQFVFISPILFSEY